MPTQYFGRNLRETGMMKAAISAVLLAAVLALPGAAFAQAPPFKPGDRVKIGATGKTGTVLIVDSKKLYNGGYFIKVHIDDAPGSPDSGNIYDTVTHSVTAIGGNAPLPPSAADVCQPGKRIAAPTGFKDQWVQAVILDVDPRSPSQCRVHPLGYATTMDSSWPAAMLKVPSAATMPIGPDTSDPYLNGGQQPAKAAAVLPGAYRCSARSGGQLVARLDLAFTILDGRTYRDVAGEIGTFLFDASTGNILFQGGKLSRLAAVYEQPTTPPIKNRPPIITFTVSGDSCELMM